MDKKIGFTIVELLIVIVVIAILAMISVVAYTGITKSAAESALQTDLRNIAAELDVVKVNTGAYPSTIDGLKKNEGTTYQYSGGGASYCVSASSDRVAISHYISNTSGGIRQGVCPPLYIQNVGLATCPVERTMAVDARDEHTYWVQKLEDNNCWMLTNLAYAGGGTNTYGDVKVLQDGTADSNRTYNVPKFYVGASANPTLGTDQPSTDASGGYSSPQFGYHYNWCATVGGQTGGYACSNNASPAIDPEVSICPSGWRLPSSAEFIALNDHVNNGSTNSSTGLMSHWLGQVSALRGNTGLTNPSQGYYWSSTPSSYSVIYPYTLYFYSNRVDPAYIGFDRSYGHSIRCVTS